MVNKVTLVGNLGKDPEIKEAGSSKVCRFPLATSRSWKNKDGEKVEETTWHNITVWNKQGEVCAQYLTKGRQVYVEGEIRNHSYDDKDGNKRYVTDIVAHDVRFLGGGNGASAGGGEATADEEIPF